MLTLRDHLSVLHGDNKTKALDELSKLHFENKKQQNSCFLKTEKERAKLYSDIVNNVTSKVFTKKLSFCDIPGLRSQDASLSSLDSASAMHSHSEHLEDDIFHKQQESVKFEGRLVVQVDPKFYSLKDADWSRSPRGSTDESWSSALTESQTFVADDQLAEQARQLRLFSYPYLIQSTKSVAEKEAEKAASRVRQMMRRQNYSKAERQRVRLKREFLEDSMTNRKIKDVVERQMKKNIQEESSGLDKNSKKNNSLEKNTGNATPENHDEGTALSYKDLVPGASGDRPAGADVYSSEEGYGSPRSSASTLDEKLHTTWSGTVSTLNGHVPQLCLCPRSYGSSAQSPPWISCANNCQFYRRPHAYLKALLDYVRSIQSN